MYSLLILFTFNTYHFIVSNFPILLISYCLIYSQFQFHKINSLITSKHDDLLKLQVKGAFSFFFCLIYSLSTFDLFFHVAKAFQLPAHVTLCYDWGYKNPSSEFSCAALSLMMLENQPQHSNWYLQEMIRSQQLTHHLRLV